MPYSGPEFQVMFSSIVSALQPTTVLDVGTGAGKIGAACRKAAPHCQVTGIEAHHGYAKQFAEAWKLYTSVKIGDAVDVSLALCRERYDLVVFGDVLEHMWLNTAMDLLTFWAARSKYVVCIWPIGFPQDDAGGVASEIHRTEILLSDLVDRGLDVVRYHRHNRPNAGSKNLAVIQGALVPSPPNPASPTQQGIVY